MSKLFFDNLMSFEEVEIVVKENALSAGEKEELDQLVETIINGKVIGKVLDKLPRQYHEEFLMLFHKCPHDEIAIFQYLRDKTKNEKIEEDLGKELKDISAELMKEFALIDGVSVERRVSKK